jgi:hypothetical protein
MTLSIARNPATALPPNLKLKQIVQSLPKEVFAKDTTQAWLMVIKTLVYHFWMSTFTIVHHTAADIPFTPEGEWNEAIAQLLLGSYLLSIDG